MEKVEAAFEFERATPNCVRFKEITEDGKPPKIGTLYVQKWAVGKAVPTRIRVSVEVEGS
jgi:hypothetical protein